MSNNIVIIYIYYIQLSARSIKITYFGHKCQVYMIHYLYILQYIAGIIVYNVYNIHDLLLQGNLYQTIIRGFWASSRYYWNLNKGASVWHLSDDDLLVFKRFSQRDLHVCLNCVGCRFECVQGRIRTYIVIVYTST